MAWASETHSASKTIKEQLKKKEILILIKRSFLCMVTHVTSALLKQG